MQTAAMDPADEPPSMLWGLDPVFSAFARLYIRDILEMTESTQVPGIYFYNLHPISKVDVLGTVVYKREREDFFCYGVDDGTGVINCLCWKSDVLKEEREPSKYMSLSSFVSLVMLQMQNRYRSSSKSHDEHLSFRDSAVSSLSRATKILKDFLKQKSVSRFRPYDVQDLLQPLISSPPQAASADQV
ncbi:CST complex subunit STN1 [Neolamprologus brichardi]|uniref:CST complex subunit STN1 n=1 Tax=Neolamprologus brichardi TaxID=32507 RepID=UPI001643EFFB|nr:CST complex subunit STN1 [Neolamprologus brichardi]